MFRSAKTKIQALSICYIGFDNVTPTLEWYVYQFVGKNRLD